MSDAPVPYADSIDIASIERNWPLGRDLPPLVRDIAALLMPVEHGTVGHFGMKGMRFDDYWIENGADLCEEFGFFLALPDGSKIGIWFHEGAVAGAEPVVGIGSEGDLEILAPNLKAFVQMWATGNVWLDLGLMEEEDTPEARARWAEVGEKMQALADTAPEPPAGVSVPRMPKFMEQWSKAALEKIAADPTMQAILALLKTHIPRRPEGSDPLTDYIFPESYQIRIAGTRVEIQTAALPPDYKSFAPLPEHDALIPLLLEAREARAGDTPGRGLWHDAVLQLFEEGYVLLKASWEFEPQFREGGRITKAELAVDLARFPRDPRYMEAWMDELV
jgi:hypothetical protein